MSSETFPLSSLPGLDPQITRTILYSTKIQSYPYGKELMTSWWTTPRYRYELKLNFLRASKDEIDTLLDFITLMKGSLDNFLLVDPYDGVSRRVRFDADEITLDRMFSGIWSCITLPMITVVGEIA